MNILQTEDVIQRSYYIIKKVIYTAVSVMSVAKTTIFLASSLGFDTLCF